METGRIIRINYEKRLAIVESDEKKTWAVNFNRFQDVPGRHGCICSVGDEVEFQPKNDKHIESISFVTIPEVELAKEEISLVTTIDNGLIFGERQKPNCGCPILLGRELDYPSVQVGMMVRHGLTNDFNGKPIATNLKVEEEYEQTRTD